MVIEDGDKGLCARLDNFLGCLALSLFDLKYTTPVLYCLFLASIPICFSAFSWPSRSEEHAHTRAALQALLTVVVPTCSLWPSRYIQLASVFHARVDIPLEIIVEDTIDGVIEFCNPINDLVDLIGSGTAINGHTICISIGWRWWINLLWWMLAKSKSGCMFGLADWPHAKMLATNSSPLDSSLGPFASTPPTSNLSLCLDSLPYGIFPSLDAGSKAKLEFTAFSSSIPIFSMARIISAIPFIISEGPRRRPRSPVSVLKQLNVAYGPDLVVESLSNISVDYQHALCHVYRSSSSEQKVHEIGMKNPGIKVWRRGMFLVALEAALVRRGWVERWAVQVIVK